MPRAQRMRWPMCAARLSVARPAACGTLMYAVFHPRRCMRKAVCASSVTVSTAMPPIASSAARRITAHEPQKKLAFQRSLPSWIRRWNNSLSLGTRRNRPRLRSNGSGE